MKLLKYSLFGFLSAGALLIACGSSDNTGGGGAVAVPCNIGSLANCSAEVSCAQTKCATELKTAFGTDYKSGTCMAYDVCLNACACGDDACTTACQSKADTNCQTGIQAVISCSNTNCSNACTGAGGAGGSGNGTSGSGNGTSGTGNGTSGTGNGTSGTGNGTSGTGNGTSGTGNGTAGTGATGAWNCADDNSGGCICIQLNGVPAMDTCTAKPDCCVNLVGSGTCLCESTTGTGLTCAQLATGVGGTVVATCPP